MTPTQDLQYRLSRALDENSSLRFKHEQLLNKIDKLETRISMAKPTKPTKLTKPTKPAKDDNPAAYGWKPGYLYVYKFTSIDKVDNGVTHHTFLKFGYSTNPPHKRNLKADGYTGTVIYSREYPFYKMAVAAESYLKHVLETGVVSREIMRDGHTETCSNTDDNIRTILTVF